MKEDISMKSDNKEDKDQSEAKSKSKGLLSRFIDKIDKSLEEKAKKTKSPCCSGSNSRGGKGSSCC
ncbi:TPA: hypothetical protein DEF17_09980 [bacterium]|nr:MAG: hypothetical protein AUJ18_10605 [Candidatus Hydrogenedentes bacterium CG1_02_42_14]PIU46323.1 MAG: hypothetical protein COS94_10435 [Candidatus Hydrogenedentes bacterium CG07_land_8_20_14_0_80_42_17]HBW48236.1 hypothetical protein [bacterium]